MKLAIAAVLMMFAQGDSFTFQGTMQSPQEGAAVIVRIPPTPVWVPDPSAGHYDCPKGWAEFRRREPEIPNDIGILPYWVPAKDAKGHILGDRPTPGICVAE